MKIELTILTKKVTDGRRICSEQDFFRVAGIEKTLDGVFETSYKAIGDFIEVCEEFVRGFAECYYGRNERTPSVEIRNAFTLARNTIGWSG